MGLWVWDGGRIECSCVMQEIGVITPRESGQTSHPGRSSYHALWVRENLINYPHEGKQMTAGIVLADVPSNRAIGTVAPSVYREVVTGAYLSRRVLPKGVRAA